VERTGGFRRAAWIGVRAAPAVVVLGGALLRFAYLGQAQIYRDEAASWMLASYPLGSLLAHNVDKTYPPLYGLLLRAWILLFGTAEWALRTPSAIPGVVTLIVAWRWTSQALGRTAGLTAAAILAVSALLIANSREARMYALETAFATVAWWLAWRLAADSRSVREWPRWRANLVAIGLGVAVAGEVWTMAFGLPAAGLQFLFALACLWLRRSEGPRPFRVPGPLLALAAIFIGAASLSVWLPSLLAVPLSGQSFWTPKPDLISLQTTFYDFLGVSGLADSSVSAPILVPILGLVGLAGLLAPRRLGLVRAATAPAGEGAGRAAGDGAGRAANDGSDPDGDGARRLRLFALAALLGTSLVPVIWLYSQIEPVYDPRYLGAAAAPLAALIVAGLATISRTLPGRVVAVVLAVAILAPMTGGAVLTVDRLNSDTGADPGRETAQRLLALVRPGDVMLCLDTRTYFPVDYYLDHLPGGTAIEPQLYDWNTPDEPFYLGTSLLPPDRVIDPTLVGRVGWQSALPGLRQGGTIWFVSVTSGNASDPGFDPLDSGVLVQTSATVLVSPPNANVGQIRALTLRPLSPP
jgi:4-amino-4-deoxy-L-arabinose transferase-like glycosyltransferase